MCVGARESYLCHHEYVIKPPLRKDGVPQQGVHEAGTRGPFLFSAESLLWALSCTERVREEGRDKVKSRNIRENEKWRQSERE